MSHPILDDTKKVINYALKLNKIGFKGGSPAQWALAIKIKDSKTLSRKYIPFLHSWYSKHIHSSYPIYKQWLSSGRPRSFNNPAIIHWLIFGGSSTYNWIKHIYSSYYYRHKDKVKQQQKQYRKNNRDKISIRNKRYYQKSKKTLSSLI
jgi:hypothetical protein